MRYVYPFPKSLIVILLLIIVSPGLLAENTSKDNKQQARSEFTKDNAFGSNKTSFPEPFDETANPVTAPAVSTGYYFIDSDDETDDYWRPIPTIIDTNNTYAGTWVRIESGPRQREYANAEEAASRWADPFDWGINGHTYFRNPAYPVESSGLSIFDHGEDAATDSTDNAIAGPIPVFVGDGFYFNGVRYDSFYVSTNGIICLTNRRYYYDNVTGLRKVEGEDCYDPMSMDWFVGSSIPGYDRARSAEGSENSTDPEVEPVEDNFGYEFAVLGNERWNPTAGIRKAGGSLNTFNSDYKAALIAPFFGDLQLSQWHEATQTVDDHGQVWFRKYTNGDTLCIFFVNAAPVNTVWYKTDDTTTCDYDLRPDDDSYLSACAQVLLCRRDSSIVINYETFNGSKILGTRGYPCKEIFRYSTTCGVRGFARHKGYHHDGGVEARTESGEYEQYTYYYDQYKNSNVSYPKPSSAVRFKQWKNTLRIADITFRVRSLNPEDGLEYVHTVDNRFTNNYEFLAGEERIGAFQPVALYQNLSNEIQGPLNSGKAAGINYQEQGLAFRANMRIYNKASGKPVYSRVVFVDSTGLSIDEEDKDACNDYFGNPNVRTNYCSVIREDNGVYTTTKEEFPGNDNLSGIPPYGYVEVYFPPFDPNEFTDSQLGLLQVSARADLLDPDTEDEIFDEWPFDDYDSVNIYSMQRLTSLREDFTEFYTINRENVPSVMKWVNLGGEIMPGDGVSRHPLPPRRQWNSDSGRYTGFYSQNKEDEELYAPVLRMNRIQNTNICDELISFPIDMRGRCNPLLILSVQRCKNASLDTWDRGWSDGMLIGPEPRCIVNSDPLNLFDSPASASATPDALVIELAKSSPDGIHGITNIGKELPFIPEELRGAWNYHPRRDGAPPVTNTPAFTLFGGGGYMVGFLEEDKDSTLALPDYENRLLNGLRPDIYDDGIDEYYQKIFVPIPDTFIEAPNDAAKNFRFRIRVDADDDKKCSTCIPDDEDPFFIDNIEIMWPVECTDVEMSAVNIGLPTTSIPASQAVKLPIKAKITNTTMISAPISDIVAEIYRGNYINHDTLPVYSKSVEIPYVSCMNVLDIDFPDWDALKSGKLNNGSYHLKAWIEIPYGDLNIKNDTTYYDFSLNFGEIISYDPYPMSTNDVPSFRSGTPWGGLCLTGYSEGGKGNKSIASDWMAEPYSYGHVGGDHPGQIAVKFELKQLDTLKGYQHYCNSPCMGPAYINYNLYSDDNGKPGIIIDEGTILKSQLGLDDIRDDYYYGEYVTALLDTPAILPKGVYWISISQLGETGLYLGGSAYKTGMRATNIIIPDESGTADVSGQFLMIHDDFKVKDDSGNLVNNNFFCYRNSLDDSADWMPFMPESGNPAFGHLHCYGVSPQDEYTWTLSRGTWIPMLRPYFGERNYAESPEYEENYNEVPVGLIEFEGLALESSVKLDWETSSEENNAGFYLERRQPDIGTYWKRITFINGAGTSSAPSDYTYTDSDVEKNTTYQYRLLLLNTAGVFSCIPESLYVTVHIGGTDVKEPAVNESSITVNPNPITNWAHIQFNLNRNEYVQVEVLDIFGNVVNSIAGRYMLSGSKSLQWNCDFSDGRNAPAGRYILRIRAGDEVRTVMVTKI